MPIFVNQLVTDEQASADQLTTLETSVDNQLIGDEQLVAGQLTTDTSSGGTAPVLTQLATDEQTFANQLVTDEQASADQLATGEQNVASQLIGDEQLVADQLTADTSTSGSGGTNTASSGTGTDTSAGTTPAATATATADPASPITASALGQPSTPSFLAAADSPAQLAPAGTADPPQSTDSIVLQPGNVDQVAAFDPSTEVLDLRQALAESHLILGGDFGKLGTSVQVTNSSSAKHTTLSFNPNGLASGPGTPIAELNGTGPGFTLNTLISDHALAIT